MKLACIILTLGGSITVAGLIALVQEPGSQTESRAFTHKSVPSSPTPQSSEKRAEFGELVASPDTRRVADWVVRTGDHDALPFLIVDKRAAFLHVFDPNGHAEAATPVLLGIARGDRFAPGAADKDMYDTSTSERITPSGRFLAQPGLDDKGHHVVWIQYNAGISIHAVLDRNGERRGQRLASPTPDDNRISFGCINLPSEFYRRVVRPLTERSRLVVYVLPDSEDALEFFASLRTDSDAAGVRTAYR